MNTLDRLKSGISSGSPEETIEIGEAVSQLLPAEAILTLEGDLGAGKTTFVKGLARGFGIEALITSPTFNICHTYQGDRTLIHMDAYRLENARAEIVDELMLEDFMKPPFCLAIEWPANLGELPWSPTLSLDFAIQPEGCHLIRIAS